MQIRAIQSTSTFNYSETYILEVGRPLPLNGDRITEIVKDGSPVEPLLAVHTQNGDVFKVPANAFAVLYTHDSKN